MITADSKEEGLSVHSTTGIRDRLEINDNNVYVISYVCILLSWF